MSISRRSWAIGLGAVAAAQGAAYLLYRAVTHDRQGAAGARPFSFEPVEGHPVELASRVQRRDGREVALAAMLGKPLLLHFWATWCERCRVELPQLLGLAEPEVLLISTDENWPVVEHFFDGRLPPNTVLDTRGDARRGFGITTLPDTYLLTGDGRALARFRGPRAWASEAATSTLRAMLPR
jgi:thiol-disulfide isomerase/thioredoxin